MATISIVIKNSRSLAANLNAVCNLPLELGALAAVEFKFTLVSQNS